MCGVMMVAAAVPGAASATDPQNTKIVNPQDDVSRRPPLLPSEKDNSNGISNGQRRPKSRVVSSRYMSSSSTSTSTSNSSSVSSSSSSSRRFPSPLISRNSTAAASTATLGFRRSVSVDRRRPAPAGSSTADFDFKPEVSAASKLLVTSTRSLSVSFQGEAFSLPISKTKVAPTSPNLGSARKGTPERRRTGTPVRGKADLLGDQVENSRPVEQHRWPGRTRGVNLLSRSSDCSGFDGERNKLTGSGNSIRAFQQSINERRPSLDRRLSLDYCNSELPKVVQRDPNGNSVNSEASRLFDITVSDSDSAPFGSTSGIQEFRGAGHGQKGPNGIIVSASFWQETNRRLRRLQDPGSPILSSSGSKHSAPPKSKRCTSEGLLSSPHTPYPLRGGIRPPSPSKVMTPVASSPSRGHSPSRIRNVVSTISNNFSETPSVLSFAVDVRRGKVGENKIIDAHLLRLLYNRHLQWRFVTARTEAVLLVQKHRAEKNLWNAWITISDLCDCLAKKRHRLQLLRQKLKLVSILKGQTTLLEDWAFLDKDHLISLLGAIEALKASTLRLPLDGGASVDIQSLQDAIGSSVDIMQAMAASIYMLLPLVEEVNVLVSELAKVTTKERALLERCMDSISRVAALQVKDSTLSTHLLQHHHA